ncbi:MAG: Gmad2 immunoglobulin-like domain-containing protein [Candidatus Azambacteria bacterium]|nr:Gmad2 immunoglobulin-like domain-containing protein [Candidatus Azambacteria bacterium]
MKKALPIIIVVLVITVLGIALKFTQKETPIFVITNFEECVTAGNPAMESYPRQCQHETKTFIEYIGNELEKTDLIRLNTPRPNQIVQSPLIITGEARGFWFFEASFPVVLTNLNEEVIAQGIATAKDEWMTSEFVPFEATLMFTTEENTSGNKATLILHKDNPSGLPEHDDALEVPVILAGETKPTTIVCTQEAKLCPDGSAVGRTGPNCEFANCSTH